MKFKNRIMYVMTAVMCLILLPGCGNQNSFQMANELCFSMDGIKELMISYDEEEVTFFKSDSDRLVVREYMTDKKSSYFAKAGQNGDSIKISEGGKPFFRGGFLRYIEIYLPVTFHGCLTVTTADGDIDLADAELDLASLRIDSTAGKIKLKDAEAGTVHLSSTSGTLDIGNLKADQILLENTGGSTVCKRLEGNVTCTSTGGDVEIESAAGSGSYKINNSGKLDVTYSEVTGDLYLIKMMILT